MVCILRELRDTNILEFGLMTNAHLRLVYEIELLLLL